jgi:hypothetical protein
MGAPAKRAKARFRRRSHSPCPPHVADDRVGDAAIAPVLPAWLPEPDDRDCRGAHGRQRSRGCLCPIAAARKRSLGGEIVAAWHQERARPAPSCGCSFWAIALVRHRRRGAGCGRLLRRRSVRRIEAVGTANAVVRGRDRGRALVQGGGRDIRRRFSGESTSPAVDVSLRIVDADGGVAVGCLR